MIPVMLNRITMQTAVVDEEPSPLLLELDEPLFELPLAFGIC